MSFKQFESIFYSAFDFYGLTDWTLEKMSKDVNIKRKTTKSTNSDGWFFKSHNGRSRFHCPKCAQQKKTNQKPVWSSVYTTILFRAQYLEEKHKDGGIWGSGRVQMKIFDQGCQTCGTYSTGHFDEDGIYFALYWLHIWILKTFYKVKIHDDNDHDRPQNKVSNRGPHDTNLCNACRSGWCKYQQQEKHHVNMIKAKTAKSLL